ncbi:MAG: hypothetical protein GF398_00470 [Chitinivibrionales bacterium]|nr:hypothetical protein [Chitinivibrionales bacterium]
MPTEKRGHTEKSLPEVFGSVLPIIIYSRPQDWEQAVGLILDGARSILKSDVATLNSREFIYNLCFETAMGCIMPEVTGQEHPFIQKSFEVLLQYKPQSLSEWAEYSDLPIKMLNDAWMNQYGNAAKYTLACYLILDAGFRYILNSMFGRNEAVSPFTKKVYDARIFEWYYNNRQELELFWNADRNCKAIADRHSQAVPVYFYKVLTAPRKAYRRTPDSLILPAAGK